MTPQAIPATHIAASIPSIPPHSVSAFYDGDVSVTVTFRPFDPLDTTEVVVSLDPLDDAELLNLLDTTITRLIAYRDAYQQAMADEDADPAPVRAPLLLPVPWYAW